MIRLQGWAIQKIAPLQLIHLPAGLSIAADCKTIELYHHMHVGCPQSSILEWNRRSTCQ